MARMLPDLSETQLNNVESQAERQFYTACRDQLPDDSTVLFSTSWVGTKPTGSKYDGEADFIILSKGSGVLVVEVKGGGVSYNPDNGNWTSIDRYDNRHQIKDPFRQAVAAKHQLLKILNDDSRWQSDHKGRVLAGHAVVLNDVDDLRDAVSPESPSAIIAGRQNIQTLSKWIDGVFKFWSSGEQHWLPLTKKSITCAEKILHGRFNAKPLLSSILAAEESIRIQLTDQQSRVMRGLGLRRRAIIQGGAGTGKTVLAIEKSKQLAEQGSHTLLLCYNRLLGDILKETCREIESLQAMTFHQLCDTRVKTVSQEINRNLLAEARRLNPPGNKADDFNIHAPYALAMTTEEDPLRFDAIVIDEGQDFNDEWWFPIECLLRDEKSHLFIFQDQNQALYGSSLDLPIKDPPFLLTVNCRNTATIHNAAYRYYDGVAIDCANELPGTPVDCINAPTVSSQSRSMHAEIVKLIAEEQLSPMQITVLVCGQPKNQYYKLLEKMPLPQSIPWCIEDAADTMGVRVDTVKRFKGLESDVVFLWGVDSLQPAEEREVLYVGISRAKSRLILVGTAEARERINTA